MRSCGTPGTERPKDGGCGVGKRIFAAVAIAAVMMVAVPMTASADHGCNGVVTSISTPAGTFYVDDRGVADNDVWIYMESNGTVGLQSGGEQLAGLWSDGCAHDNPDTLIY